MGVGWIYLPSKRHIRVQYDFFMAKFQILFTISRDLTSISLKLLCLLVFKVQ